MAADGKHGVGQAAEIIGVYQEMGYANVGLQKTRRSGQSALLLQARYYVAYCSGESGGDGEGNKSHGGLGLAVRKSISCAEARSETVIEDHLKVVTPSGSSIDDVETEEWVAPPRERRLPRRRWLGNAKAEAEITLAMTARRVAWKRQKAGTQDSQPKRAVRRENTRVHRVCGAAYERFHGRYLQGLEEDLRQGDQRGLFQCINSRSVEDTPNVSSQYIRDEESRMLRDPGFGLGRWS